MQGTTEDYFPVGCHCNILHSIYTTSTKSHNTMQRIIGDAASGWDVPINNTNAGVGMPHRFYCLLGAKIDLAINHITTNTQHTTACGGMAFEFLHSLSKICAFPSAQRQKRVVGWPSHVHSCGVVGNGKLLIKIHLLRDCIDAAPWLGPSDEPPTCHFAQTSTTPYCAMHVAGLVMRGR